MSLSTYEKIRNRQKREAKRQVEPDKQLAVEMKSLESTLEGIVDGQLYTLGISNTSNPYSTNYVVNRGTNLIANSISKLPLRIYRGQNPMEPGYTLTPGLFNIEMPNPNMSLSELVYRSILYYLNKGSLFIEVEEDPLRWTPRNPSHMAEQVNGVWRYQPRTGRGRIILPENLIHIAYFDPNSESYNKQGLSPVSVVKEEISNDNKAREYNSKYFENFGKVGVLLKNVAGHVSADDMKALVDKFNATHAGSERAWKAMGLPEGIDYEEFASNMRDMEFAQGRVDNRDRILAVLGVHKSLLGATESVDRATAKEAKRQLWEDTSQPLAIRLQQAANLQFFRSRYPAFHCRYDFSDVAALKESQKDKVERAKLLQQLGYTINETNDMLDLEMPEINDPVGDMRFIPSSLILVDDLYIIDGESSKTPPKTDKSIDKIVKLLDKEAKIEKSSRLTNTYVRNYNKLNRTITKKMAGKMGRFFAAELGKVLAVINEHKSVKAISEAIVLMSIQELLNKDKEVLAATLLPIYEEGSIGGSKLAIDAMGVKVEARVSEAVVTDMVNKIKNINNYTYKLIKAQVKESLVAGETVDQLAKRITNVYKFNSSRSRTIARTESGAVTNRSTYEEYGNNRDIVKQKQWIGGTRESHAAIDGQIKDFDEPFDNGLMFPHDPSGIPSEVINCTCTFAVVV